MSDKRSAFVEEPILSIPIRPDMEVRIHGIPWDLTQAEAEKIASIIEAMAMPTMPSGGWK